MRPNGALLTFLRKTEQGLKQGTLDVPCKGCTACCRDPLMYVDVTDEEAQRLQTRRIDENGRLEVARKPNGECVYLIDNKCTIYAQRPNACRKYDCRFALLGAPLAGADIVRREGVEQWERFKLPSREDKLAYLAIRMVVAMQSKQDPDLNGLAFFILNWQMFRDQAEKTLQKLEVLADEQVRQISEDHSAA